MMACANVLSREPYYPAGFNGISTFFLGLQLDVQLPAGRGEETIFVRPDAAGHLHIRQFVRAQQGCRYEADCGLDYYSPGTVHHMTAAFRYKLPFLRKNQLADKIFGGVGYWRNRHSKHRWIR